MALTGLALPTARQIADLTSHGSLPRHYQSIAATTSGQHVFSLFAAQSTSIVSDRSSPDDQSLITTGLVIKAMSSKPFTKAMSPKPDHHKPCHQSPPAHQRPATNTPPCYPISTPAPSIARDEAFSRHGNVFAGRPNANMTSFMERRAGGSCGPGSWVRGS